MKQLIERTAVGLKIPKHNDLVAIKANNISGEIIGRVSSEPRRTAVGFGYAVQRWKKAEQGRAVTVLGDFVMLGVGKRSPQFQIKYVRVIGRMDKDGNVKVLDKRYADKISESHEGEGSGMKQLIEKIEQQNEARSFDGPDGEIRSLASRVDGILETLSPFQASLAHFALRSHPKSKEGIEKIRFMVDTSLNYPDQPRGVDKLRAADLERLAKLMLWAKSVRPIPRR